MMPNENLIFVIKFLMKTKFLIKLKKSRMYVPEPIVSLLATTSKMGIC